jgi:Carboxypeptidase regulatory-like domain/Domain of unknown function (DUF4382)
MFHVVRVPVFCAVAIALAACSGSQSATAPMSPTMPTTAIGQPHHQHIGPRGDTSGGGTGKQQMTFSIGDVALPNGSGVRAINVGIDQIMVTDTYGNVTTVAQYSTPQVVNVMAYQGGSTTPIGQGTVQQTTYASLTIIVDTASSAAIGGSGATRPLSFLNDQTASTSGFGSSTSTAPYGPGQVAITFSRPFVVSGTSMKMDVDFNVMESIFPGRSVFSRPSLTVAQQGYEGSIAGNLTNASGGIVTNAVVAAIASDGSVAATGFTDANGNFLLHTLVAGTYQLTIYNQYVSASGWSINASNSTSSATVTGPTVNVPPGQTSQAGTIAD